MSRFCAFSIGFLFLISTAFAEDKPTHAEVVVYGGTPGGVMAAVAAAREGHTVLLVDINKHVGGVVSGGLTKTDTGDIPSIGGLSKEFFDRIAKYYRDTYGADSLAFKKCDRGFRFEPHIAEKVFNDMIAEQGGRITVWPGYRYQSTAMAGDHIASLTAQNPFDGTTQTFTGDCFIDASYEGDLMAGAGAPYSVGREGRDQYGELLAGVTWPQEERGQPDKRVMAYNYRVCITRDPNNRVLFPKPEQYFPDFARNDKGRTALHAKGFGDLFGNPENEVGPLDKFDGNWCDFLNPDGESDSTGYAEGDWATRDKIAANIRDHFLSMLWFVQNEPEVPAAFRAEAQNWGLPKDEFTDNNHVPFQLYVREARRMVGAKVVTEKNLTQDRFQPDGIATGSYGVDCHLMRWVTVDGKKMEDHTRHINHPDFDISYGALIPNGKPVNLLVPVCLSASHVAYDSIRMEPVFMMLGEASGVGAALSLSGKKSVQDVDPQEVRKILLAHGGVLDCSYQPTVTVTWSPEHPQPGQTVHFTAKDGDNLKQPLVKFWWDFDGNGKVSAQTREADFTFPLEKTYNVHFLAEDGQQHRRLVTVEVPVGAATGKDVMVHALEAKTPDTENWNGGFPHMPGKDRRLADVFFGPAVFYDQRVMGKLRHNSALFEPKLAPGLYQICVGFRPSPAQNVQMPVTIVHDGQKSVVNVDEKTETTPFPLVALGEFHCGGGGGDSVEIHNEKVEDGIDSFGSIHWVWLGDQAAP